MTNTVLDIQCMFCRQMIGTKPGLGQTGTTSGVCVPCMTAHFPFPGREDESNG